MKNVLQLENITTLRNDVIINTMVSFTVHSGGALVLRGGNGSGKTTLLRSIAGFLPIEDGSIIINAQEVRHRDLTEICHFVGEASALKDTHTVAENLQYWAEIADIKNPDIEKALQAFRIEQLSDTKTNLLSQGQKKRVALSRLLIMKRLIWVLDEPTNGLDELSIADLIHAIKAHQRAGGIVICASHIVLDFKHDDYILQGGV